MPRMPGADGRIDDSSDPFRQCSGRILERRPWTLADDFAVGRAIFVFKDGQVHYRPKGRSHSLGTPRRGDQR